MRTLALLLSLAWLSLAQTNTGQIGGRVVDASGAAVPSATVTSVNKDTGFVQTAFTDESGTYSFPSLVRGTYTVRVERAGFRPAQQQGVTLDAMSRRTADFTLEIGQVTEAIDVTAEAIAVKTSSGDVSNVITDRQLEGIALNGRNYSQLLRLVPGAMATNFDPFSLNLSTTGQRVNGIRSNSLYFMVDGADNMDNGGNSNAIINPNIDTIAEVKILTASYAAEFGGRAGGMVNVVTKSGTREFHGSAFEYVRNNIFDARSFFAQTRPPLRFNNFGWTLGGPLYFPNRFNTEKSKLFFFAGMEWKYNRQGVARTSLVPTQLERTGDFRGSPLPAPVDPLNGNAPFPDRVIPQSRWSFNGPRLLNPYPSPNFGGPGGNYVTNGSNVNDSREYMIKGDWLPNQFNQVSYRFTHNDWPLFNAFQGGDVGIVPGGRPRPGWTTVLTWNRILNPTTTNAAAFSVTSNEIQGLPRNTVMRRDTLGLNFREIFPVNEMNLGPNVSIAGFTGYNGGDRIRNLNTTFQFRDDFSKVAGPHTLKFGVQYTRSRKDQNNSGATDNGAVVFNTSAARTTRNVIGDVLLGNFQTYTEGQQDSAWWMRFNQLEIYAQDSWRVSKNLTLELGVRYNLIFPLYSALGNFSRFDPLRWDPALAPQVLPNDGSLVPGTGIPTNGIVLFGDSFPDAAKGRIPAAGNPANNALFVGLPRGGVATQYTNFGPRIGFSFDPAGDGKTAIRGGYGLFFDRIQTDHQGGTSQNPPFVTSSQVFDGNIDNPGGATLRQFPANLASTSSILKAPLVHSYNFGVQREAWRGMILDVGYVGTLGRFLLRTLNINQLPAGARVSPPASTQNVNFLRRYRGFANINQQETADNSNYHSLQVSANQRFSRGLSFGLSYTWSKTLDTSGGTPQDSYDARIDYGLSAIHRAHVLNVNYVYDLPISSRVSNAVVRAILGGWQISGITSYQSGSPNTVTVPVDVARIGVGSSRATVIGSPNLPRSERTLSRWFNAEAFLDPSRMTVGRWGNSGRNVLIGPSFTQWDAAAIKNFRFKEKWNLQFRAESFNVFNNPAFTSINTTVRFDSQGRPAQNYGAVTGSNLGRIMSFGLRLAF